MIIVRFPDEETQKRALGFLIGRFSGHSWASGEVAVPDYALAPLAREGVPFAVEGPANRGIPALLPSAYAGETLFVCGYCLHEIAGHPTALLPQPSRPSRPLREERIVSRHGR